MSLLESILTRTRKFAAAYPFTVIALFLIPTIAGYGVIPSITITSNPVGGVGRTVPVIKLTQENTELFGQEDSLIVALEFTAPPEQDHGLTVVSLAQAIRTLPSVLRVRCRLFDPDNEKELSEMLKLFLLGMSQADRDALQGLFSAEGITHALRRNRNRLYLTDDPYVQRRIMQDPLEIGRLANASIGARSGAARAGDPRSFFADPGGTAYLIEVTLSFGTGDITEEKALVSALSELIPRVTGASRGDRAGRSEQTDRVRWSLLGETAFHVESDRLFDYEMARILCVSFALVFLFLLLMYHSMVSVLILILPTAVAVGCNYGIAFLTYEELNPVVIGNVGILFGLGADFGVHLWGRFREELDKNGSVPDALNTVYRRTAPAVVIGGFTSVTAFLCLYSSHQTAIEQFGFLSATGVALALLSTLLLFPAIAVTLRSRSKDHYPRMAYRFHGPASWFMKHPRLIVGVFPLVMAVSFAFALNLTYERDIFKAFVARGMDSLADAQRISAKFQEDFSLPTHLTFEVKDFDRGLELQKRLDDVLRGLRREYGRISSFDSITGTAASGEVRRKNIEFLAGIAARWDETERNFRETLTRSDLTTVATTPMLKSFNLVGGVMRQLGKEDSAATLGGKLSIEESRRVARSGDKLRFLTKVRYSHTATDPNSRRSAKRALSGALKEFPVPVGISGVGHALRAVQSTVVSEVARLGVLAVLCVMIIFLFMLGDLAGLGLSMIPMLGAFCVSMGILGGVSLGIPFSIIAVAPLLFGLAIDNGVHVVMRRMKEDGARIPEVMAWITPLVIVTSLSTMLGFLSMVISSHYSLEFLGWAMLIGLGAALALTLLTLPALILILDRQRERSEAS